jgi:hypothetical protein
MSKSFPGALAGIALFFVAACASRAPAPVTSSATTTKTIRIPGIPSYSPTTTTQVPPND